MPNNLKKEIFSGVFYTAIAKYSGIVVSLLITAILARLLSPDEFGIVAIATIIITFFNLFTDMGISPAIIQNKELTTKELSEIFSFTVWAGFLLAFCFFLCSWGIAAFYNNSQLILLCQLLSINLLFAAITIVPNALLYKNKEFKFIAWRSLSIQVASGIISIIVALQGGGLYALIISPIISSALLFVLSIRKYPQKVQFTLGIQSLKKIFKYSAYQFLFNVINYFSRNLDKLLIGKYMNMNQLGYYEKSYRLMMLPLQNITQVITPVMHPIFSDFQNNLTKLASSYERIIRLLAFIGFPLSILLFFISDELILILFGEQWNASIPVFRILSLSVGIQIILSSSGSIFQASGDTRSLFICGLVSSILNVTGLLIGLFVFGTLESIAWFICATFTTNFFFAYWIMYKITFKLSIFSFFKQLFSPLILSLLLGASLWVISPFLNNTNLFFSASVKSFICIIIFVLYIQYTKEYDIFKYFKRFIKKA